MTLMNPSLEADLTSLYDSPTRFYHTSRHVVALLALLNANRTAFHDPDAVEAAIWFHDAIYDSESTDNEAKSAVLAVARLAPLVETERLARIRVMIEATTTHTVPEFDDIQAAEDMEKFLDMDLSILAADEEQFDAYEEAVRREYAWVEEPDWRRERAKVLQKFLDRPAIFYSELFRDKFEEAARGNIKRSLNRLNGPAPASGDHLDPPVTVEGGRR